MGLFDFFRRRSERESALSGIGEPDPAAFSVTTPPEVSVTQTSQTLDATGAVGLRDDMFEILRRHGIDPESGQAVSIDASTIRVSRMRFSRRSPATESRSRRPTGRLRAPTGSCRWASRRPASTPRTACAS
jgi:hypothetical protein